MSDKEEIIKLFVKSYIEFIDHLKFHMKKSAKEHPEEIDVREDIKPVLHNLAEISAVMLFKRPKWIDSVDALSALVLKATVVAMIKPSTHMILMSHLDALGDLYEKFRDAAEKFFDADAIIAKELSKAISEKKKAKQAEEEDDESEDEDQSEGSKDLSWIEEKFDSIDPSKGDIEDQLNAIIKEIKKSKDVSLACVRLVPFKIDADAEDLSKQLPNEKELIQIAAALEASKKVDSNITVFMCVPGDASDEEIDEYAADFSVSEELAELMAKDQEDATDDSEFFYFVGADGIDIPLSSNQLRKGKCENPYLMDNPLNALPECFTKNDYAEEEETSACKCGKSNCKCKGPSEISDEDEVGEKLVDADAVEEVLNDPKISKLIDDIAELVMKKAKKNSK